MQASRNISDAWLAHWIRNIDISNTSFTKLNSAHAQTTMTSYSETIHTYLSCFLQKIFSFQDPEDCVTENNTNLTEENVHAKTSYYLAIYIGIAVFNSLISLIRAFSFAYAGVKAAKFMHDLLLNSVLFVSEPTNSFFFLF